MRKLFLVATAPLTLLGCATTMATPQSDLSTLSKIGEVDTRYQSYNVEMVEVTGGRFWAPIGGPAGERYRMRAPLNLANPKLRALASHLGPAYIRVSGTWANSTYLPAEGEEISAPPPGFNQLLTRDQWRGVVAFAKAVDAKIVTSFPASQGARDADGNWNPEQAQRLVDLTRDAGGSIYGAELFNEPTMPQHGAFPAGYSESDFSRDFRIFRTWARKADPELKLTGPGGTAEGAMLKHGSGQGGPGSLQSEHMMEANPNSLDIVSYHHYGTVSARCGPMKFGTMDNALLPEFLEMTVTDFHYYDGLRDKYEPGKPLWLNETAQAACGGSPWASTFLDSFRYLNQLGVLAQKGVAVVAHNTLAASDYGLIDQDTLEPRPNYWAAVLWKRTMGSTVLASPKSPSPDVRIYAHCLAGHKGGVGLTVLNTSATSQSITVGMSTQSWVMTASPLDSKAVEINGNKPQISDSGKLTGLDAIATKRELNIPPKSIAFVAAKGADNSICQ